MAEMESSISSPFVCPRMSNLHCCCRDKEQHPSLGSCWAVDANTPGWGAGGKAASPAPLGSCFPCLGWVCLFSPWLTPEGWWGMAQPAQLSWELLLAGSGAFRERCNALWLLHAPSGHQSSEQAQRGLGWTPEPTVEPCLLFLQGQTGAVWEAVPRV